MGHTDVVPVNPKTWTRDPFGGELVNGEVWGRGAVDMLNLTASQAVALKALARQRLAAARHAGLPGLRGRGGGRHARRRSRRASGTGTRSRADYLLTENGGTVSARTATS